VYKEGRAQADHPVHHFPCHVVFCKL